MLLSEPSAPEETNHPACSGLLPVTDIHTCVVLKRLARVIREAPTPGKQPDQKPCSGNLSTSGEGRRIVGSRPRTRYGIDKGKISDQLMLWTANAKIAVKHAYVFAVSGRCDHGL